MKHFTIKLSLAVFFFSLSTFECRSQIFGTNSVLNITANNATVVDPGLTLTETGNITDMNVQISSGYISGASGDLLGYTGSLPSGINASFDNIKGVLSFTGTTNVSNWQTLLRTVTIQTVSTPCFASKRGISFVIGNKLFNPSNGHYYTVGTPTNWNISKSTAQSSTFYGREGYLATVTSQDENNFIFNVVSANCWIGGSDNYQIINAATGTTTYADQAASESNFYWISGPEKGTQFSTGLTWAVSSVNGSYINWSIGEPNDYPNATPGDENFVIFGNNSSNWNDEDGVRPLNFLIEYGDMPNDATTNNVAHSTRNILINNAPSGTMSGDIYVCTGSSSATITLTPPAIGGSFSVSGWESSADPFFTSPASISNTSNTLSLSGLTKSTYFRAIVNTSSSPTCANMPTPIVKVTLNSANGTWTGTSNGDWTTSSNWCGGAPTSTTDVFIHSGTPFTPQISNDASCRNLSVFPGATLTIDPNINLEIYGNINSAYSIDASTGDIFMNGSSEQILPGSAFLGNRVDDITINNSNGVTLSNNLLILSNLRFTSGLINTSNTSLLTLANGSSITGAGASSYVNGPLKKIGNTAFKFEIGRSGRYAPCAISAPSSSTNSAFSAEYFKSPINYYDNTSIKVSGVEHWNISRTLPSDVVDVSLYYTDATFSGITNTSPAQLIVAHYNGTYWEDANAAGSHTVSGGIVKVTGVSSFSPFTFGTPGGLNPLPVKLINFVAIPDNVTKTVELNWENATEENSKYYEVLHSVDFANWTPIGKITAKGSGNSYAFNHQTPSQVNHYKLKEVSINGNYSYSDIKLAKFVDLPTDRISIYPNPSLGNLTIANAGEETSYDITDLTGKLIQSGTFNKAIEIQNLPKGVYIVRLVSDGNIQNEKIVIQ